MADINLIRQAFLAVQTGDKKKLESLLGKGTADITNESQSILHAAAEVGNSEIANYLITKGATLDIMDVTGATPLHYCSKTGKVMIAKMLLDKNAVLDPKDSNAATPLHWACQMGQAEMVKFLIERGADVEAKAKFDTTPLHIAARSGSVPIVHLLLQRHVKLESRTSKGYTALHIAAMKGVSDVCGILLKFRANMNAVTPRKASALHIAAAAGDAATVKILVHFQADPSLLDTEKNTASMLALKNSHQAIYALLEKASSPIWNLLDDALVSRILLYIKEERDLRSASLACKRNYTLSQLSWRSKCRKFGCKAEHAQSWSAHYSFVRQICAYYQLSSSAQLETALLREIQRIGMVNAQPLHIPPEQSTIALIEHGVNPDAVHVKQRISAVHLALQKRAYDIVHLLVEHGADINFQKPNGNSTLHDAAMLGEDRLCLWLIDIRADPNLQNAAGDTPLMAAAKKGLWQTVFAILKKGADINVCNKFGENLLHTACSTNAQVSVIYKLIDHGIDINRPGFAGNTPLHIAAENDYVEIVTVLLEKSAHVNIQNSGGSTALHTAVFFDSMKSVRLLMKYGSNPNIKNNDGVTPFYFARLMDHRDILTFFAGHYDIHTSKETNFVLQSKDER